MVTVVCTAGEAPSAPPALAWLNASQRIIAVDGGLVWLKELGRRADLWIGDGDSLPGSFEDWAPWCDATRALDRAKDDSDTEAAVNLAVASGADQVWLLGGGGGRMDHWLANLRLATREPRLTRWLTRYEESRILAAGDRLTLDAGTLSLFPLGSGPWSVTSRGLRWPVDAVDFESWHSLSNEVDGAGGSLYATEGKFLVLRPIREL